MKKRRNPSLIVAVFMLVAVGMIIGYAYLSKTLNINGTIGVTRNTWNVKFRNIQVENGSVSATSGPELDGDATTITITPTLNNLGDYYEFTTEVYNEGSIDAMLQAVPENPLSTDQQKLLEWSLTYDDGITLTANDILKSHESDTLRVRVSYKTNIASENDLNSAGTSSISFTITYVQADSTANVRERVSGANMLIRKANVETATYTEVSDDKKKEMFTFSHSLPEEKTDYRYIGKTPNNYITFNGEEWRIIGIFDGKIKIIRNQGIDGNRLILWDCKQPGLGSSISGYGSNDWSDAQLMYMLNRQYVDSLLKTGYTKSGDLIKDKNGNVIYRLGYRPASQANGLSTYTGGEGTTTWNGLTDIAKSQVAEVTWNLGGLTYDNTNITYGTTEVIYQAERGTNVYSGRPTTWKGMIALMYPSDYGYTFGKGVHDGCYGNPRQCYGSSSVVVGAEPAKSWLFNSTYQWTFSPYATAHTHVVLVGANGEINGNNAYGSDCVRPCVYLKSDIRLTGSGTSGDPYQIVAN